MTKKTVKTRAPRKGDIIEHVAALSDSAEWKLMAGSIGVVTRVERLPPEHYKRYYINWIVCNVPSLRKFWPGGENRIGLENCKIIGHLIKEK